MLEHLTVPRYLQRRLEEIYRPHKVNLQNNIKEQIAEYTKRIDDFSKIPLIRSAFKKKYNKILNPQDLAVPRNAESNFSNIAGEAAIYFKQGQEMLKTSIAMHENSSPLVEYYGFLQCVKGTILLELEVNQDLFFSYHGLMPARPQNKPNYINAKIMPFGVFPALLLRVDKYYFYMHNNMDEAMNTFFSGSHCLSIETIIDSKAYYDSYDPHYHGNMIYAYIGSWILSSLVRYHPKTWEEILQGKNDEIIRMIRDYRRYEISRAIRNLLREYAPDISSWS